MAMALKPSLAASGSGSSPQKIPPRVMSATIATPDMVSVALKRCTLHLCVGFCTSAATVAEDVVALTEKIPAVGKHRVLSVAFNSDDPVGHEAWHEHLGQYFQDSAAKYNNTAVWRGLDGTSFIHKCADHTWRIGSGLDSGHTSFISSSVGGLTPPLQGWVDGVSGEVIPAVVVADTTVWAGVKMQRMKDLLKRPHELESIQQHLAIQAQARASNPLYELEESVDKSELSADHYADQVRKLEPTAKSKPKGLPKPKGTIRISDPGTSIVSAEDPATRGPSIPAYRCPGEPEHADWFDSKSYPTDIEA